MHQTDLPMITGQGTQIGNNDQDVW